MDQIVLILLLIILVVIGYYYLPTGSTATPTIPSIPGSATAAQKAAILAAYTTYFNAICSQDNSFSTSVLNIFGTTDIFNAITKNSIGATFKVDIDTYFADYNPSIIQFDTFVRTTLSVLANNITFPLAKINVDSLGNYTGASFGILLPSSFTTAQSTIVSYFFNTTALNTFDSTTYNSMRTTYLSKSASINADILTYLTSTPNPSNDEFYVFMQGKLGSYGVIIPNLKTAYYGPTGIPEVYYITGSYTDATVVNACTNGTIATLTQISNAKANGADFCTNGYITGPTGLTIYNSDSCTVVSGVNCYGIKLSNANILPFNTAQNIYYQPNYTGFTFSNIYFATLSDIGLMTTPIVSGLSNLVTILNIQYNPNDLNLGNVLMSNTFNIKTQFVGYLMSNSKNDMLSLSNTSIVQSNQSDVNKNLYNFIRTTFAKINVTIQDIAGVSSNATSNSMSYTYSSNSLFSFSPYVFFQPSTYLDGNILYNKYTITQTTTLLNSFYSANTLLENVYSSNITNIRNDIYTATNFIQDLTANTVTSQGIYDLLRFFLYKYNIVLPLLTPSSNLYIPTYTYAGSITNKYIPSKIITYAKELNPTMFFNFSNYYDFNINHTTQASQFNKTLYIMNLRVNITHDGDSSYKKSLSNMEYNDIISFSPYLYNYININVLSNIGIFANDQNIIGLIETGLSNIGTGIKFPIYTYNSDASVNTIELTPLASEAFTNYEIDQQNYTKPSLKNGLNTEKSFLVNYDLYGTME